MLDTDDANRVLVAEAECKRVVSADKSKSQPDRLVQEIFEKRVVSRALGSHRLFRDWAAI